MTNLAAALTLAALLSVNPAVFAAGSGPDKAAVLTTYADIAYAGYQDSLIMARAMREAIRELVDNPSEESLTTARQAWLAAREPYGQTEVYRFYGGPIDAADGPEGRINAWPLDEGYVDYVEGNPESGIINDPGKALTKEILASLNEQAGEENISTGYHAIEFLLWGQDLAEDGPGDRPHTDFRDDGSAPHADRRRQYLLVVTDLLIDDLESLVAAWAPDVPDNHRARFIADDPQESLRKILIGMGTLSRAELAGERMEVALDTKDQEDEHSCFSDNTHRDIVNNALGIRNVYFGQYRRVDGSLVQGPGLHHLVNGRDRGLADAMVLDLERTLSAVMTIRPPFDREIAGSHGDLGRQRVQAAVAALKHQTATLVEVARVLGIERLNVEG